MEVIHELFDPRVTAASVTGFLLLWFILARFLFRPVLGMLDARSNEIRSTYSNANSELSKAEEFRAEYEKKLAGIEAEARSRMQIAIKEAQDTKDEIITDARNRSEEILKRGQEELAREREKTLTGIREEVVDISLAAASRLIEESLDDAKHRKLISDFIDRIGTTK